MCVIITCETARPSKMDLELAHDYNPHGAGIAWIEGGEVRFEKGMDVKGITKLAATVPMPFVLHYRWASVGRICAELCHPFPIRAKKQLSLAGKTKVGVLFHNGTWADWRAYGLSTAASTGVALGDGPMSDSRTMAYIAAVLGTAAVSMFPRSQRVAVLTPKGIERHGDGWIKLADGIHVSNLSWLEKGDDDEDATETSDKPLWRNLGACGPTVETGVSRAITFDAKMDGAAWDKAKKRYVKGGTEFVTVAGGKTIAVHHKGARLVKKGR